jgi:hypothetical protein
LSKISGVGDAPFDIEWHWNEEAVDAVEWRLWDELIYQSGKPSIYLDSKMMKSILSSNSRDLAAVVWKQNGRMIGIALVEDAEAESIDLDKHIDSKRSWFSGISKMLHGSEGRFVFRVRVIGPVLGSGLHSDRWAEGISKTEQRRLLTESIFKSKSNTGASLPHVAMLKDVPIHYEGRRKQLYLGWIPLEFDPEMLLHLNPEWSTIEDYMQQLNTKSRTKIKRVLKVSSAFVVSEWSAQKLEEQADDLIDLYSEVFDRSGFRLGKLHAQELLQSKRFWGDDFIVLGYELDDELIGFQCAYRNQHEIEAFFVGFRPELVKSHAIYQRMLIEFTRMGIESGCTRVNMGRTALDVKSSIGALPQRLQCDVRFRNPIFHKIAERFTRGFDPASPVWKKAWKADSFAVQHHSEFHSS